MARRARAKRETSAGGVVFRCTAHGPRYLMILDAYENWGFPKGHVHGDEAPEAAARREVREETGLDGLELHVPLGVIDWYFRFRGRLIHKFCHFFLFESARGRPTPQEAEGITRCEWQELDGALAIIPYANARAILEQAARSAPTLCRKARRRRTAVG